MLGNAASGHLGIQGGWRLPHRATSSDMASRSASVFHMVIDMTFFVLGSVTTNACLNHCRDLHHFLKCLGQLLYPARLNNRGQYACIHLVLLSHFLQVELNS